MDHEEVCSTEVFWLQYRTTSLHQIYNLHFLSDGPNALFRWVYITLSTRTAPAPKIKNAAFVK